MGELNGTYPDETQSPPIPRLILVAGPAGSGKSSFGKALASHLGWEFVEGDDWHTTDSIEKMQQGIPLGDADRKPWLERLNALGLKFQNDRHGWVLACSALCALYRQWLFQGLQPPPLAFWLRVSTLELQRRLESRQGHFFHPRLLQSQLELQETTVDLKLLDGEQPLDSLVKQAQVILMNRLS